MKIVRLFHDENKLTPRSLVCAQLLVVIASHHLLMQKHVSDRSIGSSMPFTSHLTCLTIVISRSSPLGGARREVKSAWEHKRMV